MRPMNRAAIAAVVLAAALAGGCSGTGTTSEPANTNAASVTPSTSAGGGTADYRSALACLRRHGIQVPENPSISQIRAELRKLPADRRSQLKEACKADIPPGLARKAGRTP